MGDVPGCLDPSLRLRAVSLEIGQGEAGPSGIIGDLDFISRLPKCSRFELE